MPGELLLVVITSGVAAIASVVGGLLALWHRSSTLISSLAFGVASGALIGTVTLEMLPTALESGGLAWSTGPVRDPTGKIVARFNSIWRLEPSGQWRVVFDKGSPPSPGPK